MPDSPEQILYRCFRKSTRGFALGLSAGAQGITLDGDKYDVLAAALIVGGPAAACAASLVASGVTVGTAVPLAVGTCSAAMRWELWLASNPVYGAALVTGTAATFRMAACVADEGMELVALRKQAANAKKSASDRRNPLEQMRVLTTREGVIWLMTQLSR